LCYWRKSLKFFKLFEIVFSHAFLSHFTIYFSACCKRTGLHRTGPNWTGKTRTESVFYKSRTAIQYRRVHSIPSRATKDERSQIKHCLFSWQISMFLPIKFNVCDDHDHLMVSKLGSGWTWLAAQIKTCQELLTNIEDSHANRQWFYERSFILSCKRRYTDSVQCWFSRESFGGNCG
jgi:hypothetical protein